MANRQSLFYVSSIAINGKAYIPKKLTIIVGPNNAGKSRLLRKIREDVLGEDTPGSEIEISLHFPESARCFIDAYKVSEHLKCDQYGERTVSDFC